MSPIPVSREADVDNMDIDSASDASSAAELNGPSKGDTFASLDDPEYSSAVPVDVEVGQTVNITQDGGVTKTVLAKGNKWKQPEVGDEVHLLYTGRLVPKDGNEEKKVFDSNTNRESPFTFPLGRGQVIQGWDKGIATMKKGEKAVLTIKPEYGYGETGAGDSIPPNSTLEFEVELLGWKSVNALTTDNRVTLKILNKSEDWKTPRDDYQCFVRFKGHYEDGIVFDQQDEFSFTLAVDESRCPPYLATAVRKMKKGEVGLLTVHPEHLKDNGTLPSNIDSTKTLKYEVELKYWYEVERIEGGVILKKILKEGDGWKKPKDGSKVKLVVEGRYADDDVVFLSHPDPVEYTLGTNTLPEAVEVAVETMKKGEKAHVTSPGDYGYGHTLAVEKGIASEKEIVFDIELLEFDEVKETWDLKLPEKISTADDCRNYGNIYFKDSKLRSAIRKYERALKYIEHERVPDSTSNSDSTEPSTVDDESDASLGPKLESLKVACWSNLSMCYLKQSNWRKVIELTSKILETKSNKTNIKALYRRSLALYNLVELDDAKNCIQKACEVDPENMDVRRLQMMITKRIKEVEAKEKQLFKKMFVAMGKGKEPTEREKKIENGKETKVEVNGR
ncbi:hypothetical protein BKA69DRAFT_1123743 [Paraphysoderma sedebokerense]|nr:hypothetical protein BKA69DRAFT_1123743 [Paraphysoderma sedebokerense]